MNEFWNEKFVRSLNDVETALDYVVTEHADWIMTDMIMNAFNNYENSFHEVVEVFIDDEEETMWWDDE